MELLIEILLELIFEGTFELSSNKKVPKWVRYPLIAIIVLFFAIVIFGLLIIGIRILNENIFIGIVLILISLILLIRAIKEFKNKYMDKRGKEDE